MTEKEKLETLILQGYKPHMVILRRTYATAVDDLPVEWKDKDIYFIPLNHPSKKNIKFYFVDHDTYEYAKKLVDDAKTVIGHHLIVSCGVNKPNDNTYDYSQIIESLRKTKDWDVRVSGHPNIFEIHFDLEVSKRDEEDGVLKDINTVLTLLSLKHKIGFYISFHSVADKYKAQPFALNVSGWVNNLEGFDNFELQKLTKLIEIDDCREAILAIKDIHSQINSISKITVGWATIEDLFNSKPEHILNKTELKSTFDKIKELNFEKTKEDKTIEILKNPNLLAIKSRNERIAENICSLTDNSYEDVYDKVKNLASARGKLVHTRESNQEIENHLKFIFNVLGSYINSKTDFNLPV